MASPHSQLRSCRCSESERSKYNSPRSSAPLPSTQEMRLRCMWTETWVWVWACPCCAILASICCPVIAERRGDLVKGTRLHIRASTNCPVMPSGRSGSGGGDPGEAASLGIAENLPDRILHAAAGRISRGNAGPCRGSGRRRRSVAARAGTVSGQHPQTCCPARLYLYRHPGLGLTILMLTSI